jgi:hypothetical protein
MLRSFMSLLSVLSGGEHDHNDDFDTSATDFDHHDFLDHHDVSFNQPQVHPTFGNSVDQGTLDPQTGTATFPDGTVIQNPYQDQYGQVYKSREDWLNGQNGYTQEPESNSP